MPSMRKADLDLKLAFIFQKPELTQDSLLKISDSSRPLTNWASKLL